MIAASLTPLSEKLDALCKGLFIHVLRTAEHDGACMFSSWSL